MNHRMENAAAMIRNFGVEKQLSQVQEEAAELIVAISHYKRGRPGSAAELAEEAGDLYVMLDQVRIILGDEDLDAAIAAAQEKIMKKLQRLE